jgi:hypothetical protein
MKENYLFVDIVSALFLLVIFIGNVLGLLFIMNGNSFLSILISAFLAICYHFLIKLLVRNKEVMVKNSYLHYSSIFWVFFVVLGISSYILISHFINIEYNCKSQIRNEVNQKLTLVSSFSTAYGKRANSDLLNYKVELYGEHPMEVADAMYAPKDAVIKADIHNLDTTINAANAKFKAVFDNWERFSLMNNYDRLNEYIQNNLNTVNKKLAKLPKDKTPLPNVDYDTTQLPLNNPFKLNETFEPDATVPLATVLITHLFILIPFFSKKIHITIQGKEPEGAILL